MKERLNERICSFIYERMNKVREQCKFMIYTLVFLIHTFVDLFECVRLYFNCLENHGKIHSLDGRYQFLEKYVSSVSKLLLLTFIMYVFYLK